MNTDAATVYGLIIAGVVPGGASLWTVSSLRGALFTRWQERIDVMSAGLTEGAIVILSQLQVQITDLLGTPAGALEPNRFGANPAELVHLVGRFQKVMKARDSVLPRFRRLLRVGPILVGAAIGYLGAVVACGLSWTGLVDLPLIVPAGLTVGALSIITGALGMAAYITLTHQLSSSEILSYELFHLNHPASKASELDQ